MYVRGDEIILDGEVIVEMIIRLEETVAMSKLCSRRRDAFRCLGLEWR